MARIAERSDVLAVVGMTREAKLLTGAPVVVGGGDTPGLIGRLEQELRGGVAGVISFGLCGALDPSLEVGDLVIGSAVADGDKHLTADFDWTTRLTAQLPEAKTAVFARAERPVATIAEKAALRDETGAGAVDLESHAVAKLAGFFGVPYAILRAVSDDAGRALPHAAQVGLGVDGRPAIGPVMASLRNNPWQLGALIRTALEAEDGFHALEHARQTLGPRLAGPVA